MNIKGINIIFIYYKLMNFYEMGDAMVYKIKSIKNNLFIMIIIITIVITLAHSISYSFFASNIILDIVDRNNTKQVEVYGVLIDNWLQERLKEIETYANNPIVKNMDWEEIEPYLRNEMKRKNDIYINLFVAKPDGSYNTNLVRNAGNIAQREYFHKVMMGEKTISSRLISISTGQEIIVATAPILNNENEIIGLMGGAMGLIKLKKIVDLFNINEININSYIIDDKGDIILSPTEDLITRKSSVIKSNIIQKEIFDSKEEVLNNPKGKFSYELEDSEYTVYYYQIPSTDGWRILLRVPTQDMIQPIRDLYLLIIIIFLIITFGSLIIIRYFTNKNVKPIIELKEVFDEGAKGNLNVRANVNYPNELGEAGRSFNIMMNKISSLTYYDPITNLPNRDNFLKNLKQEIIISKSNKNKLGLILILPINLNRINDIYGFELVNKILKEMAHRINKVRGIMTSLAHISWDEFVILSSGIKSEGEVIKITRNILEELQKDFEIDGEKLSVNYNAGIAFYPTDGEDAEKLLNNARIARLRAKIEGYNNYKIYNIDMNQKLQEELAMEKDLQIAIKQNEFKLAYQPFIDVKTGEIVEVEALIRWHHPLKGIISPFKFIPMAEENGLIIPIGEWVLREACRQNKEWQNLGYKPIIVTVNIAVSQFEKDDFVENVKKILKETGLEGKYLGIEITEGMAMKDTETNIQRLHQLKDLGIKILIDDFGTGFSSLSYFAKFPIDSLKIDSSFIKNIENSPQSKTIISTIVSMSNSLNIENIAEGVETNEQFDFIKKVNCNKVQGYLFKKPIYADEFGKLLKEDKKFL